MGAEYAFFPLVIGGKTPALDNWREVKPGVYPPVGNHGIRLDADDLIIDADPRHYPPGRNPLHELVDKHLSYALTRVVSTPRGGFHYYYKKPPDVKLKQHQTLYPGIDFQSDGQYVAGAGTMTVEGPTTVNGVYSVRVNLPVAFLPQSLLDELERVAEAVQVGSEVSLLNAKRWEQECMSAPVAVSGQHGNDTTYKFACRGRDLALPIEITLQGMADFWNPRCLPPWAEAELSQIVESAYKNAKNAFGALTPQAVFTPEMGISTIPVTPPLQIDNVVSMQRFQEDKARESVVPPAYIPDSKGINRPIIANVACALKYEPRWKGKILYNEFASKLEYVGRPEWRDGQLNRGIELDKDDESFFQVWFSRHLHWEITQDKLNAGLMTAAYRYHPVRAYLDSLTWDGYPRLDRILIDIAGAEDNPYHRAVGSMTIKAAVRRIYEPGIKHDLVPVLEGQQGTLKSTFIATLGGPWYSANELNRGDKDSFQNLRGRWFVELPEINATFTKADNNWLKGIISNPIDVYRGSFERVSKAVPRESVFLGSINPNCTREYLKDDENRRYLPVKTGRFDIPRLIADRDQYFAEAVYRCRQGEPHWITDPVVAALARVQQDERREVHPWVEMLKDWVIAHHRGFKLVDVCTYLDCSKINFTKHKRTELYGVLRQLDCEYEASAAGDGIWIRKLKWEDVL